MLQDITPIILTYNEEANIRRTLTAVSWAREVVVVDSFSNDATLSICRQFDNVRLVQRKFDSFANQSNFALAQNLRTEWVLSMDADYLVSAELQDELAGLVPSVATKGFRIHFDYLVDGVKLRGSLYPPRTALYRRQFAVYQQDGHTQRVHISGEVGDLQARIAHDDRKPFNRWLGSQRNYARQEAIKLRAAPWSQLSFADKLRKLGVAPIVILPYTLFARALILDGPAGIKYTLQRLIAEMYLQKARLHLWFS